MLLSNNLPRFLPRSFTNSCEKVGRGEKSSLLRFVKLFATTTTAGLLPEGCQFVTRKLSSSPITTTRSRERIVAESLPLFVLICSPELRLAHFFIRSRKGEGVRAELFDSLREESRLGRERKRRIGTRWKCKFLFTRTFLLLLRSKGKGNIFLITRW